MVRGKNRIPYWIDWRLTGLAEPDYGATISFGLPIEPEDSQYGKYRLKRLAPDYLYHIPSVSYMEQFVKRQASAYSLPSGPCCNETPTSRTFAALHRLQHISHGLDSRAASTRLHRQQRGL